MRVRGGGVVVMVLSGGGSKGVSETEGSGSEDEVDDTVGWRVSTPFEGRGSAFSGGEEIVRLPSCREGFCHVNGRCHEVPLWLICSKKVL
jgi:hypothetical protein